MRVSRRSQHYTFKTKLYPHSRRLFKIWIICCIVFLFFSIVKYEYSRHQAQFYFLDVGQGDGSVVIYRGQTFLIDGGGKMSMDETKNIGRRVMFPFLLQKRIQKIDIAFVSHVHYDHINGILELLEEIKIEQVVLSAVYEEKIMDRTFEDMPLLKELIEKCEATNTTILFMKAGDRFSGKDIEVFCHYPRKESVYDEGENNNSLVLEVKVLNYSVLYTGDLEKEGEKNVESQWPDNKKIQVLKIAHHGSETSSTQGFLEKINPEIGVVSVGKNTHGHPSPQVLETYDLLKIPVYLTQDCGMIEVIITKKKMTVKSYVKKRN